MIADGIELLEGSTVLNMTVASGAAFPGSPNLGELYYRTATTIGLFTYDGAGWVAATGASSVTDRHITVDATAVAKDAMYVTGDAVPTAGQEVLNPFPGDGGDQFGYHVSLSDDGTRCLITARWDDTGDGLTAISGQGTAKVYLKTGTVWAFEANLLNPDPTIADYFGLGAMMSGDGTRCVVGAPWDDAGAANSGSVYVFNRVGTTWTLDTGGTIANPVALIDAHFGGSVAINDVGDKMVIGADQAAPGAVVDAGSSYVYARSGETWTIEQTIDNPNSTTLDYFGAHVEMSNDGLRIEMSAPQDDVGAADSGTCYIYRRDTGGTVWSLEATISNPDVGNDVSAKFGYSVRFDANANRMVVSAPLGNDEPQDNRGVVYVYTRTGTEWTQEQKIVNPDPTGPTAYGAQFGERVEISGDGNRVLIGVWADDPGGVLNAGTAYLYGVKDCVWAIEQEIINPGSPPLAYDFFGGSVALDNDGTTIALGAYGVNPTYYAGAVYFFEAPLTNITLPAVPVVFDEIIVHNTKSAPLQLTDPNTLLNGGDATDILNRNATVKLKYIDGTVGWLVIET